MSELSSCSLHQLLQLAVEHRLIRDVARTETRVSAFVLDGLEPIDMDNEQIRELLIRLLENPPAGFSRRVDSPLSF